jgi:hypothetical protein
MALPRGLNMINRLSAMLVAIGLLAGVIYLGILSGQDSKFVVWFGIASAIAAPIRDETSRSSKGMQMN